MYGIGIAQNHPPHANGPSRATYHFTPEEKRAIVEAFGEGKHPEVYLVDEHAGGEKLMPEALRSYDEMAKEGTDVFAIPLEKRIGRVAELIVDEDNNLVPTVEWFYENPRTREIIDDVTNKGGRYGFSVGIDNERVFGGVLNKRFSHLGLTKTPEYAGDPVLRNDPQNPDLPGTWVHFLCRSTDTLDKILAEEYLSKPGVYAAKRTLDRVRHLMPPQKQTVGATRSNSEQLIHAMLPPPERIFPAPTTMSSTPTEPETPATPATPTTPIVADDQDDFRERERVRAELESAYDDFERVSKDFKVNSADDMAKAHTLHQRLVQSLKETGLMFRDDCPTKYLTAVANLGSYIGSVKESLKNTIKETTKNPQTQAFMEELMKQPDRFRHVAETVFATGTAMANMRQAQETLDKERAELKKAEERNKELEEINARHEKRAREFDEQQSNQSKRGRYDEYRPPLAAAAPAKPVEVAVKQTVGATRYFGSTIPVEKHVRTMEFWDDLNPSTGFAEKYAASPFSARNFDPDMAKDLRIISDLAKGFMSTAHVDGPFASYSSKK